MTKRYIPPDVYDALLQINLKVKDVIAEKLNVSDSYLRERSPDQPLSSKSIDIQA